MPHDSKIQLKQSSQLSLPQQDDFKTRKDTNHHTTKWSMWLARWPYAATPGDFTWGWICRISVVVSVSVDMTISFSCDISRAWCPILTKLQWNIVRICQNEPNLQFFVKSDIASIFTLNVWTIGTQNFTCNPQYNFIEVRLPNWLLYQQPTLKFSELRSLLCITVIMELLIHALK